MIKTILVAILFCLSTQAGSYNKYELETEFKSKGDSKFAESSGYLTSSLEPNEVFDILSDPHLYVKLSSYVIKSNELKNDIIQYKICVLFICKQPKLKMSQLDDGSIRWDVVSGSYKGTYGVYQVSSLDDSGSVIQFNSFLDYSESMVPDWIIEYGVEKAGSSLMKSTYKYLKKKARNGNH